VGGGGDSECLSPGIGKKGKNLRQLHGGKKGGWQGKDLDRFQSDQSKSDEGGKSFIVQRGKRVEKVTFHPDARGGKKRDWEKDVTRVGIVCLGVAAGEKKNNGYDLKDRDWETTKPPIGRGKESFD